MKSYRVIWEIDVDAESPRAAAEQALAIQRDPASDAEVFEVIDTSAGGKSVFVDMGVEEQA